jgi:hypothetical protein
MPTVSKLCPYCGAKLTEEQQYLFEERAAIMEFDGGLSRKEAERLARIDILEGAYCGNAQK